MAEEAGTEVVQKNSSEILCKFNNLDEKYETLRKISSRAVVEYEDLQLKCQENFEKFKEERSKYLQVREDLERLKQVSSLALDEYENLHRKYEVEQDCRDNAEKYATKVVNQNKELRRQSQMIIAQFGDLQTFEFPEDLLTGDPDDSAPDLSLNKEVLQNLINELKASVEDLKKELKDARDELAAKEEELLIEKQKFEVVNRKFSENVKEYKQLNRVSVLALEEYNDLQRKYDQETHCRTEAEKFAAEVLKENKILARRSDIKEDTATTDTKLSTALKEIEDLTNSLEKEKATVKELNRQLESGKGNDYTRVVEQTLTVTQEQIEQLENRLNEAEKRAEEAEKKVSKLEKKRKKGADETKTPPPSPSTAVPPPPPPPPPPNQLLRKFMKIVGSTKRPSAKKAAAQAKDPRAEAMNEMMERIKSGRVHLKPAATSTESDRREIAPGMSELGSILKSVSKSNTGSTSPSSASEVEEPGSAWSCVKLKTTPSRTPSTTSDSSQTGELEKIVLRKPRTFSTTSDSSQTGELEKVVLRKPRSKSAGSVLDDDSATNELKKILQKKRAAAEPDLPSETCTASPSQSSLSQDNGSDCKILDKEASEAASLNEAKGCLNTEDNSTHSLASIQEVVDTPQHKEPPSSSPDPTPETPTENTADSAGESNSTRGNAEDS